MSKYDISTFTWYTVEPKPPEMAVNVSDSGGFFFNAELRKRMPEHFVVGASPDKRVLCVAEAPDTTYTLPKSGRAKIPALLQDIKAAGVILPARYVIHVDEGCFIGELKLSNSEKACDAQQKPVSKKPRRISKSEEEHILEGLSDGKLC